MKRRAFLGAAAGGAGAILLRDARSAWSFPANEQVRVALVGLGGRGSWFVDTMPRLSRVVALCDVNQQKAEEAYRKLPDLPRFTDFRRLFDEKEGDFDAVVVATPDHVHAAIAIAAMERGKHVYVEKPLAHDPYEARRMRLVARERKVATQMGNQGTAAPPFRRALELLRAGAIGELREVHAWNNGGGPGRSEAPKGEQPVPDFLDWDLWLGPAAVRPFHREWMNGWQGWRDFGTGNLGNWASHTCNLAFRALDLPRFWREEPKAGPRPVLRVTAAVSEINPLSHPRWETIAWDAPAREPLPPIRLTWHNGSGAPGMRDRLEELLGDRLDWGDQKAKKWQDFAGVLFVGAKGRLHATGHNATFRLLPEADFRDIQCARPETLENSRGHENEWLDACRGGKPAWSHFDAAGPFEEFLLMGNVATRFEGALDYDPVEGKIVNRAEADRALKRDYRKGWEL